MRPRFATHFAEAAEKVKRRWKYKRDKGGDYWTWGKRVKRLRGVLRYFYVGDCEDYCFRLIWVVEGRKKKAIKALKDGKYRIWWAATGRDGGRINHAVVECVKTGEYAEVIFGEAVRTPNTGKPPPKGLGTIRLRKKMSGIEALIRLREIESPYYSDR